MNIAVFGGSGFLGSHVCDKLSDAKHKVLVVDKAQSPYLRNDQEMCIGDITDSAFVEDICKDIDTVFNFAGIADLSDADFDPVKTAQINVMGNIYLLDACRKANIKRYIFASSLYVYGQYGGFYRCSKQSSELFIDEYYKKYGLEYTILRYGSLYGPRADMRNGIYKFVKQALTENKITYYGSSQAIREYIDVEDAALMTVDILKDEYINSNILLSGTQPLQVSELFFMIGEILGKKLDIEYQDHAENTHYVVTPYSFMPKVGKKMNSTLYTDLGQGLLKVMDEVSRQNTLL